jgi:poly(A) polymerase Pap1
MSDLLTQIVEDNIEKEDERSRRLNLIEQLKYHLTDIYWIIIDPNLSSEERNEYEPPVELVPFGSFAFETNSSQSDIDLCMISYLSRDQIFGSSSQFISLFSALPQVSNVLVISGAYIPIISFKFCEQEFDMNYAQLSLSNEDKFVLNGKSFVTLKCLLSYNGPHTHRLVTSQVDSQNKSIFRYLNIVLKVWAQERGIYGNKIAMLGSITIIVLVAFYLKLIDFMPKKRTRSLEEHLFAFFLFCSRWKWNTDPIDLFMEETRKDESSKMCVYIQCPKNGKHNTSYNVLQSTFNIISKEWERALVLLYRNKPDELFEARRLSCNNILEVIAEEEDSRIWCAHVDAQIRSLIQELEVISYIRLNVSSRELLSTSNQYICKIGFDYYKEGQTEEEVKFLDLSSYIAKFKENLLARFQRQDKYIHISFKLNIVHSPSPVDPSMFANDE